MKKVTDKKQCGNPENCIIAFDIHGVLFKPDFRKIAQLVWRNKIALLTGFYLLNPRFAYTLYTLLKKKAVPEEYFITLTTSYPSLSRFKELAIDISNAQRPIPEMVAQIPVLKKKGYELHVFSNIGAHILADLIKTWPHIFNHFDTMQVPNASTRYISKSHQETYSRYVTECNPYKKQIIFIDNNKSNVARAAKVGITGIHYVSAQQSLTELQHIGIL